jgi:cell wall-associated NlpC family hydrolase
MYQPIGHVTIYIGDGMMASAPTEGEPVQVVSVQSFASDIVGATRLVG